jgi:hypothetical protein
MNSADKSYTITPFALSGIGEMTSGFLILCIPAIPKLVKSTPALQKLFRKIFPLNSQEEANSRLGLPTWIRAQGQGSPRRSPEDSLHSTVDAHADSVGVKKDDLVQSNVHEKKDSVSGSMADVPEFITMQEV